MQPERDEVIRDRGCEVQRRRDNRSLGKFRAPFAAYTLQGHPAYGHKAEPCGARPAHEGGRARAYPLPGQFAHYRPIGGLDLADAGRGGDKRQRMYPGTLSSWPHCLVPEAAVYNLRAIATKLGIDPEEGRAHRATADAELTMERFPGTARAHREIPLEVLQRDRPRHRTKRLAPAPPLPARWSTRKPVTSSLRD